MSIAPEQEEEEQDDQKEEASVTCTDSEKSSDEQDGSPQDTTRTPFSKIAINMDSCLAIGKTNCTSVKCVDHLDTVLTGCCCGSSHHQEGP